MLSKITLKLTAKRTWKWGKTPGKGDSRLGNPPFLGANRQVGIRDAREAWPQVRGWLLRTPCQAAARTATSPQKKMGMRFNAQNWWNKHIYIIRMMTCVYICIKTNIWIQVFIVWNWFVTYLKLMFSFCRLKSHEWDSEIDIQTCITVEAWFCWSIDQWVVLTSYSSKWPR